MDFLRELLYQIDLWIALLLIVIGWYFGTRAERKHLARLQQAEHELSHILLSNERFFEPVEAIHPILVTGSVVIAQDRFKLVWAKILSVFGKNLTIYEMLLERGRREAVVRMKRQAGEQNCTQIYGIRFETSMVDGGGIEVLAYGTAVRRGQVVQDSA